MIGISTLIIKRCLGGREEFRFNFYAVVLSRVSGRDTLHSFLEQKAKEAEPRDDFTWEHVAYIVAAQKIHSVPFPGTIHTFGWSITLERLTIEGL
jgi:hypothetical protein